MDKIIKKNEVGVAAIGGLGEIGRRNQPESTTGVRYISSKAEGSGGTCHSSGGYIRAGYARFYLP